MPTGDLAAMAAKSKPRYLLMRAVSTDACDSALAGESPVDALSDMYLRGEMTTVRRSASPPEIEPGEVVFDRQEGLLYVHDGSTRSEEHTSELQSLMRNSYAVISLKKN